MSDLYQLIDEVIEQIKTDIKRAMYRRSNPF